MADAEGTTRDRPHAKRRVHRGPPTRHQIKEEQRTFEKLGALRSLTFTRVGPAGPDIYRATFTNGAQEWRIWLSPEGRVDFFNHRPVATPK